MRKKSHRLQFPAAGKILRYATQNQPPFSCFDAQNVRLNSANGVTGIERGGSRPGIAKAFDQQLGSGNPVRLLTDVTWVSSNSLINRMYASANGTFYREQPSGTMESVTSAVSLSTSKMLHASDLNQVLYIADHDDTIATSAADRQPKMYTPSSNTLANWTASGGGTIPKGCPAICTWRGRIILAGGTTEPYGLFGSKQDDPLNWDFADTTAAGAFTLATADQGRIGETVTALCPFADDCLIVGCPTSLHILMGDPKYGGSRKQLSAYVGVVDKHAWCTTPDGWFVFLSQNGVWAFPAGCLASRAPEPISTEKIPTLLLNTDRSTTTVTMAYDLKAQGIHIYQTSASTSGGFFLHWPTKSFWPMAFSSSNHGILSLHARRNTASSHSTIMHGCRDGYIRRYSEGQVTDDGTTIDTYLYLGPFADPSLHDDVRLDELEFILTGLSGEVTWRILSNTDAPHAAVMSDSQAADSGTITGDDGTAIISEARSQTFYPRVAGGALYLKLSSTEDWGYESGRFVLSRLGKTRV